MSGEYQFPELDLGNIERTRRFYGLTDSFVFAPDADQSILKACDDGSQSGARVAHQLLHDEDARETLTFDVLHQSVVRGTAKRLEELQDDGPVLLLQDATPADYRDTIFEDMCYSFEYFDQYQDVEQQSANIYTTLAVTSLGLPLGLLQQEAEALPQRTPIAKAELATKEEPAGKMQDHRWIRTFKQARRELPEGRNVLVVGDQKVDLYELFAAAQQDNVPVLARCLQTRTAKAKKLFAGLEALEPTGETIVRTARRAKTNTPSEDIRVEYAYKTVELPCPRKADENVPETITVTAIYVREVDGGKKGVEWYLLTNQPIENADDAVRYIGYYQHFWKVERLHFVFRWGCNMKPIAVPDFEAFQVTALLYSVIALQSASIMYLSRTVPNLPAGVFWDMEEQRALYCAANRTREIPEEPYTLGQAVGDLSALDWVRTAPSDGPPGVRPIWQGLERLYRYLEARKYMPKQP